GPWRDRREQRGPRRRNPIWLRSPGRERRRQARGSRAGALEAIDRRPTTRRRSPLRSRTPRRRLPILWLRVRAPRSAPRSSSRSSGLGTNRGRWDGLGGGGDLLKEPLGVFVGRRFQKADRARSVVRASDSARVKLRERDPGSIQSLVRSALEVAQNPVVVCGDLARGAARVKLLEEDLRRLAEGLRLRDEDGHRPGAAALTEQR